MKKILKIKKLKGEKLFKTIKGDLEKNKSFQNLVDKYYKIKTLAEHLEGERQALRTLIILLMEEKGFRACDTAKYYVEVYIQPQTRLNIEEMRKVLPKEQLEMFEVKITTKALRVLPKNEEEATKEVIKNYPQIFKGAKYE
ncbi:MAG: hypothetical protein RMJ34_07460 [candidate division WOR-3 bacterium]|nr:hypothetical protein [candidate division WOR-3 bacterium]